ncbi:DNA adenine methylase [Oceanibaculum pacificum]|uniref:DNA adenine methylase n=1 Tax=Oceanibaculum pacificum TaxID=580166 RepID=UPI000A064DE5|nr:DNA adenine methylase [Oceanibaculum pacificum]
MLASPLRYPGGKAKLFNFFANLLAYNQVRESHYCEPYAGGAGLALKLLSGGLVDRVSLNDVDESIWAFWVCALQHNSELCRLIETANLTIDEWHRQREIWRAKDTSDILALGFSTFFLNRTNRSGIIEGAGPVGGYAQTGKWRLDARFDREKQAATVRSLAPFRSHITVSCLDALDFLSHSLRDRDTLTYLDPPYYVKGSKLYRNAYTHNDHVEVKKLVEFYRDSKWVVSYDAVAPILDIYSEFDPILYSLNYSAGAVGFGKEVIFLSDVLAMPAIPGFERHAA